MACDRHLDYVRADIGDGSIYKAENFISMKFENEYD